MSTDEQDPAKGGIPHAFGNAIAWKWTREMPRTCKGGFLTMLYALRQMAAPSGELRFNTPERPPLKMPALAKAAGCREKDARRYIDAAIRAGVVVVVGDRKRGKTTLYRLVVCPWPDWERAAAHLKATARPRQEDESEGSSGHSGPNSEDTATGSDLGPQRPELSPESAEGVRATEARASSGHRGPNGSGHRGPNIPCGIQAYLQETTDVVDPLRTPEGAVGKDDQSIPGQDAGKPETTKLLNRCPKCAIPLLRPGRIVCAGCELLTTDGREVDQRPVQGVFLTAVPSGTGRVLAGAPEADCGTRPEGFAPLRVCDCGREFHTRQPGTTCPDCQYAASAEATRLADREVSTA